MLKTLPRNGKNQERSYEKKNKGEAKHKKNEQARWRDEDKQIKINYIRLFIMFGQKEKAKSGDYRSYIACCDEHDNEIRYNTCYMI